MKNYNLAKLVVTSSLIALLNSCGIPKVTIKENSVELPANFTPSATDSTSSADVKWKNFFEDANLNQVIDVALLNNKELNSLLQKVAMSQNEIQAKKGEYLPNLNLGAGADLSKVGEFTRNGAVEHN